MDTLLELLNKLRDVKAMVAWGGYVGLTGIIFAETGLFVGFFLPGDSLLVTAGLLASQPQFGLNPWLLGAILTVASIAGNATGYWVAASAGPRLFSASRCSSSPGICGRHTSSTRSRRQDGDHRALHADHAHSCRSSPALHQDGSGRYTTTTSSAASAGSEHDSHRLLSRTIPGIDRHIEKVIIVVMHCH
jgi:membrane-associated protein